MTTVKIYGRVVNSRRMFWPMTGTDETSIFNAYYKQRDHLLGHVSCKLVSGRITGKEYKRRVKRINEWVLYKTETKYAELVYKKLKGKQ